MTINAQNKFDKTSINQIERIHKPQVDEFRKKIFSSRKPVIITGTVTDWKSYSLWSIEYLNNVVGNKETNVNISQNKIFTFDPQAQFTITSKKMNFTDFTDWIVKKKQQTNTIISSKVQLRPAFPNYFQILKFQIILSKNYSLLQICG